MRWILHRSDGRDQSPTADLAKTGRRALPQAALACADHIWQLSRTESTHPSFPGRRLLGIHPAEARRVEARARGGGWGGGVVTTYH